MLEWRLGGAHNWSGQSVKRKFVTLPGLHLQPLGRPARSQWLYRLTYPGSSDCIILAPRRENYNFFED
jgi:hypothetical protein